MKSLVKLIISLLIKLAFIALIYAIVIGLTSCSRNDKPILLSFSTEKKEEVEVCTEPSREAVVSESSETTKPSYSSHVIESNTETTEESVRPTEKPKSKSTSKAPTKKAIKSTSKETKKTITKAPTKVPEKDPTKAPTKVPTKKPTSKPKATATPTPKPYTYCTCDAEVSCGSTAAGTYHKFTIKGLTAHKLKSGLWEITEASDEKVRAYMKTNYPESANHYGVGKLKNKRDYRYKP